MQNDHDDPSSASPQDPQRRRLLAGMAASGAATTGALLAQPALAASAESAKGPSTQPLPAPEDCGIDHFVIVMMENRSFDHFLGWVPGAEGRQAGLSFADTAGHWRQTHDLAPDFQNCSSADPDHSYGAGRGDVNDGAMDGFLKPQPAGDTFPIGYYTAGSLPFYAGCAQHWTICDHYFSGILSCTFPNRIYMHSGQTDRVTNTFAISKLPTIWDRLKAAGLRGRYYFSDVPVTALWGAAQLDISRRFSEFKRDAAAGRLPAVSYIDPALLGTGMGISRDDHPYADIRDGQAFLNDIYDTLRASPNWERTLMIVNYDEWGGFFDHVAPPFGPVSPEEFAATGNDGRLGIRVPCVAIGPKARRGHVESTPFDPNAILNMLAWRFGFEPLGVRGSTSTNFAHALDFSARHHAAAPAFDVPPGPFGTACVLQQRGTGPGADKGFAEVVRRRDEHLAELQQLRALADRHGFR